MNGKEVIKRLKEAGWEVLRVRGSHYQMGKDGERETVPVHGKHDIPIGTLRKIERNTGVNLK